MYQIECFLTIVLHNFLFVNYAVLEWPLAGAAYIAFGNPWLIPLLSARSARDIRVLRLKFDIGVFLQLFIQENKKV